MIMNEKEIINGLYGLMLGDGSLSGGYLRCVHTNKQRFYVEWLEQIFNSFGIETCSKYDYKRNTTFGIYMYSDVKIKIPNKEEFKKNTLLNGKKYLSDAVLENINPFGLLLWFLDDGSWHVSFKDNYAKRFGYLNTQGFSYEDNVRIKDMFKERFDIDLRIHTDKSGIKGHEDKLYYKLYFNATNFRKFFDIVRPYLKYIPKEFYYKFDMKYKPNRLKNSIEFSKKYNLTT